jgi:hypothetical protein
MTMHPAYRLRAFSAKVPGRIASLLLTTSFVAFAFVRAAWAPCSLPDLPTCACYIASGPWPPPFGDNVETARSMIGVRSSCIKHGGQAYWQIQRQATIPECAEALAFENPDLENDGDTDPEAWCTETIAYWAERASAPYPQGYYTARHHASSYVRGANEMREWYIDEEAVGGLYRGRWIDGTELDYANFEPGVNGPCPGAYQQIFKWDPLDLDGDGTAWNDSSSHSQLIDSMVVYRLGAADGPVQRIDVHMVEGNVGYGGESIYARVIDTRWYQDIIHFTALGDDDEVLDGTNHKIRGWGINLNADGSVDYEPGRIRTIVQFMIRAYPAPTGSENSDAAHVAQILSYYATTGGNVAVSSNSSLVTTGGALPTPTTPWVIPAGPHPVDPVYIDVDLLAEHPTPVSAITIDWVDGPPVYFEVWWSGVPVQIMKRFVTVPTGAPAVPPGTTIPFTVALDPQTTDAAFPIRYARICVPLASLTRTFQIRGFHYHFYSDDVEDANESSPEGDAIASDVGDGPAATPALRLSPGVPNPFGGTTTIRFEMPAAGPARLALYDVHGRRVRTLFDGARAEGPHEVSWDGRDDRGGRLPAGVYFAHLEVHGDTRVRKLVLIR